MTTMNRKKIERLTSQLVKELKDHAYRDEIVRLATDQLIDDIQSIGSKD